MQVGLKKSEALLGMASVGRKAWPLIGNSTVWCGVWFSTALTADLYLCGRAHKQDGEGAGVRLAAVCGRARVAGHWAAPSVLLFAQHAWGLRPPGVLEPELQQQSTI